ncbi:hypothetical protein U2T78_000451 [Providencia stuartii]|uniref:Uncharacterized protein n=1 Tax=Providencia stuartii TaxID=588 RepID=A0AAJ1N539_PROST|nr:MULTISPECIES: hypothetical protein [Providencia]EMA3639821.1 hypothetical protein [Providencia stuartii]MBW3100165.1 hypothetical protein [Providencia stuartii]MCB5217180.1 hypothetical protein [Providencia stuartii]MDE5306594.1 hypothetical protein [Providencia stuartii]MDE8750335.1 hypothetical protein [Providencia thailandensis]
MADINATDFYKGALWAADILITTSPNHHYLDEVRDILEHIPNLYSIVMQTPETEVCDLRLLVDREFPLGRNADYASFEIVPLSFANEIVTMPEKSPVPDEIYQAREDIGSWGVVANTLNGEQKLLITGLYEPRIALNYAQRFTEQLAAQKA